MVISGAPILCKDHAERIANMALEMNAVLQEVARLADIHLQMRIGINTGPAVAGVIGSSKFSYDLWGDAVNLASRMEDTCPIGAIQVMPQTQQALEQHYRFELRPAVEVKGKGVIQTYILLGKK